MLALFSYDDIGFLFCSHCGACMFFMCRKKAYYGEMPLISLPFVQYI